MWRQALSHPSAWSLLKCQLPLCSNLNTAHSHTLRPPTSWRDPPILHDGSASSTARTPTAPSKVAARGEGLASSYPLGVLINCIFLDGVGSSSDRMVNFLYPLDRLSKPARCLHPSFVCKGWVFVPQLPTWRGASHERRLASRSTACLGCAWLA